MCHVHGYTPYLYVPVPCDLDANLLTNIEHNLRRRLSPHAQVLVSPKKDIYGYNGSEHDSFLKISLSTFEQLNELKRITMPFL